MTGAVIPVRGGIVLDMSRMNRIKSINRVDRFVIVEPGITCGELNKALLPDLFFPRSGYPAPLKGRDRRRLVSVRRLALVAGHLFSFWPGMDRFPADQPGAT